MAFGENKILVIGVISLAAALAAAVVIRIGLSPNRDAGVGQRYDRDARGLGEFDANLIICREVTSAAISPGFKELRGVAVGPGDSVYVAGDRSVRIFEKDGRPHLGGSEITADGRPRCLAVSEDGNMLFVGVGDRVEVFGGDGRHLEAWPAVPADSNEPCEIASIAIGGGDIFIGVFKPARRMGAVLRYDRSGRPTTRAGQTVPGEIVDGLVLPSSHLDVAVGPDGLLRAVNPGKLRIEAYTFDGTAVPRLNWGGEAIGGEIRGFMPCCNPSDMAIMPDGGFVTAEKGMLPRVKLYLADGSFEGVVAGPEQFPSGSAGMDIAADSSGRILVADAAAGKVRVFVRVKPASAPASSAVAGGER